MREPPVDSTRYPLRAVIRQTGLSADALRAWERRYGAVHPTRSSGGQRLYSVDDVERLILLKRATTAGHSIGEIATLDREALERLLAQSASAPGKPVATAIDALVRDALSAADALDGVSLEQVLRRGALSLGSAVFVDEALPRVLRTIGERWHRGEVTPAHEHLASQVARRVLTWVTMAYDAAADAPRIIVATLAGELHELGAMLAFAVAAGEGWRPVYLGPDLPAGDIASAAEQVGARAVALSLVHGDGKATLRQLEEIERRLPEPTALIIGGMAAVRLERSLADTRILVLQDLEALRLLLRERRSTPAVAAD